MSLSLRTIRNLVKTWVTDVNLSRLKRRSLSSPSPSAKQRWLKAVSKSKDNPKHVEVSVNTEAAEVAVEVVEDAAATAVVEEAALHSLPMATKENREKDAQEPKMAKEVAADVVAVAEVAKMVMHPDVEVTAEVLRDKSTKMESKSKSKVKSKRKDKPSEESPEKVPTLMTASQELAVEREINRSLVVAVDNGEMPSKTSPLKKVRKRPKRSKVKKKPSPKKRPRLKKSSKSLRKLKSPMYSSLLMIT
jgi:hypothetical protein